MAITKVKPKKFMDLLSQIEEASFEPIPEDKHWIDNVYQCIELDLDSDLSLDELEEKLDIFLENFESLYKKLEINRDKRNPDCSIFHSLQKMKLSSKMKKRTIL